MIRVLTLCLLLVACVGQSNRPDWYVSQGLTLSECGPAVAAMAERIVRGNDVSRFQVRQFSPNGMNGFRWWNLDIISKYLDSAGVPNRAVTVTNTLSRGIYHVDGNHFVIAFPRGGGIVLVANPFGTVGVQNQSTDVFKERITQPYYVGF